MKKRTFARVMPLAAAAALAAGAAWAAPAVTIYSGDLAFVRESRGFALEGDTLRLAELPDGIDVTSIRFAPSGSARVTSLVWNADVANGDRALEKAIGRVISVRQGDERWLKGTLLAYDGAWLMIRAEDGFVHTASRGELHEVVFSDAPWFTGARPRLEVGLAGARGGRVDATLSYLTGGLNWNATHTLIRRGAGTAEWSAVATVSNHSGVSFADATLKLVAGSPARATPPPRPYLMKQEMDVAMASAPTAELAEESFSEYHLYALPGTATLPDRTSRQLAMIEAKSVKITPRYVTRAGGPVMARLEAVNSKADGPGVPLPAGRVRIFEADASGALQYTGESSIGHVATGEEVTLDVGVAFDLAAERREVEDRRISEREREYDVEVKVRNQKDERVTIRIEEPMRAAYEILKRSHPFEVKDARTITFDVDVPAGGEVVVTYTARVRY